jgi:hypothetical protein
MKILKTLKNPSALTLHLKRIFLHFLKNPLLKYHLKKIKYFSPQTPILFSLKTIILTPKPTLINKIPIPIHKNKSI